MQEIGTAPPGAPGLGRLAALNRTYRQLLAAYDHELGQEVVEVKVTATKAAAHAILMSVNFTTGAQLTGYQSAISTLSDLAFEGASRAFHVSVRDLLNQLPLQMLEALSGEFGDAWRLAEDAVTVVRERLLPPEMAEIWPVNLRPGDEALGMRFHRDARVEYEGEVLFTARSALATDRLILAAPSSRRKLLYVLHYDDDHGGLQGAIVSLAERRPLIRSMVRPDQVRGQSPGSEVHQLAEWITWSPGEQRALTFQPGENTVTALVPIDLGARTVEFTGDYTMSVVSPPNALHRPETASIRWLSDDVVAFRVDVTCNPWLEHSCNSEPYFRYWAEIDLRSRATRIRLDEMAVSPTTTAAVTAPPAQPAPVGVQMDTDRLQLADGTVLIGTIESQAVEIASSFGKLHPVSDQLARFANGLVELRDSTRIRGTFTGPPIRLRTTLGVIDVPAEQIITITRAGASDAVAPLPSIPAGQGVLTGRVLDNFDRPLAGVRITIIGSTFSTESDAEGRYQIAYVPGEIRLAFTKSGHDEERRTLTIGAVATYPVEEVSLIRVPPGDCLFRIGSDDYESAARCTIIEAEKDHQQFTMPGRSRYIVSGPVPRFVGHGPLRLMVVLDPSRREQLALLKVEPDGTILVRERPAGWAGFGRFQPKLTALDPTRSRIGDQREVLEVRPMPGRYALVGLSAWIGEGNVFPAEPCYLFEFTTMAALEAERQRLTDLAQAIDSNLARQRVEIDALQLAASIDGLDRLKELRGSLANLRKQDGAPNIDATATEFDRRTRAVVVAAANAAADRSAWNEVIAWVNHGAEFEGSESTSELGRHKARAEFEIAAATARAALERQDWQTAAGAARNALTKQESDEMQLLRDRAEFAWHEAEARTRRQTGDVAAALGHLRQAVAIRDRRSGFDLPPEEIANQNVYLKELVSEVAVSLARTIKGNKAATSEEIDKVFTVIREAANGGVASAEVAEAYRTMQELMRTPGRYLGAYMERIRSFMAREQGQGSDYNVTQIFAAPDGDTFYTVEPNRAVREWRVSDPQHRRFISEGGSIIGADERTGAVFHVGKYRIGGYPLTLIDPKTGQQTKVSESGAEFRGVAITRDGRMVVLNDGGAGMSLTVRRGAQVELNLGRKSGFCCAMAISPDLRTLTVGHGSNHLRLFDIADGVRFERHFGSIDIGRADWTTRVWFSSEGDRLAVTFQKRVKIFEYPGGKLIVDQPVGERYTLDHGMRTLVFDGSVGNDKTVVLRAWDIDTRTAIGSLRRHDDGKRLTTLSLLDNANTIAVAFNDGAIELYAPRPSVLRFAPMAERSQAIAASSDPATDPGDQLVRKTVDPASATKSEVSMPPGNALGTRPVDTAASVLDRHELSGLERYDGYNAIVGDGAYGFVIVGAQDGDRQGESKARLRRIGPDGTSLIDLTFLPHEAVLAGLVDVARLAAGDVVAAGWLRSAGKTADDCWVARFAPDGQQRWSRAIGGATHERCYFVKPLADGDVLVGGRTEEDATGKGMASGAIWRLEAITGMLRPSGQTVIAAKGARRSAFQDAAGLADGSVVLVGWLTDVGRTDDDLWVVKLTPTGETVWEHRLGDAGPDLATAILARPDGSTVILGHMTKPGAKASSGLALALHADGRIAWRRELDVGPAGNDKLQDGLLQPDGTLIAIGAASDDAKAPFKGWVVHFSQDGTLLGERLLDWPSGGRLFGIESARNGLVGVGVGRGSDHSGVDGWIVWLGLPRNSIGARSATSQ
jgi:hypothetical protein